MGLRGTFKSGLYYAARLFLLSLLIVSVYEGHAFGETYKYDSTIGVSTVRGFDNSHFNNPTGVAVDGSGNVYVADEHNNRIQKFDSSGVYVNTIDEGLNKSHFKNPYGTAVDFDGNLYVADSWNSCIQKFNSSGVYVNTIGVAGVYGSDNSHFNSPTGVAVDGSGNVYVADSTNNRIQKFDSSGVYVSTIGVSGLGGSDNRHFDRPSGVAVDGSGNVYVADEWNNRIQKFNSSGVYVSTIGITSIYGGSDNSHFKFPTGVAVDGSGNIYVADSANNRIQKFDPRGVYVSTIGASGVYGWDNSHFNSPTGVAVDASGNIYVADSANDRIQKFSLPIDNCTATLSSDLSLHVPIAIFDEGQPDTQTYELDFQWTDEGTLTKLTLLTDASAFKSCTPATILQNFDVHIPAVIYYGSSYWLDLQYDGINFMAAGYGPN